MGKDLQKCLFFLKKILARFKYFIDNHNKSCRRWYEGMKNINALTIIGFVVVLGGFLLLALTKAMITFTIGIVLIFIGLILVIFSMEKGKKGSKKG